MLHLLQPTDPRWIDAVADDLPGLLADHAHCELKAAQSALSMVGRFGGEAPELIEPLSHLAREETAHFREVSEHMEARGVTLGKPEKDDYVGALRKAARADGEAPALLDRLLVSALIEARSCERFQVLADGLTDESLTAFYRGLMAAEARHFTLFRGLAEARFGADARRRLARLAEREAEVAHALPLGPTVHG
ncbi:MAG: tRNA-(ms[2]io[6]A)-hydroxylase [Deltaproteobacteria bacterium]|nr:tRNA-(ms[2]io[6]A)-hydroxylase [Deltaproteobacteria bacterium]